MESFRRLSFASPDARRTRLADALSGIYSAGDAFRVLDVGCGSGQQLLAVLDCFPHASGVGIDLSVSNIHHARSTAASTAAGRRATFVAGHILDAPRGPFDAVISDSVLHLVDTPDDVLYTWLNSVLTVGGYLIATIPFDGVYNRLLWSVRRVLKRLPGNLVDRIALTIAKLLHRGWNPELLIQRLPYLYMVPTRRDGKLMRSRLRAHGLRLVAVSSVHHASFAQAKHRLVVYVRTA